MGFVGVPRWWGQQLARGRVCVCVCVSRRRLPAGHVQSRAPALCMRACMRAGGTDAQGCPAIEGYSFLQSVDVRAAGNVTT